MKILHATATTAGNECFGYNRNLDWRIVAVSLVLALLGVCASVVAQTFAGRGGPDLEPNTPVLGKTWIAAGEGSFRFAVVGDKTGGSEGDWPLYDRTLVEVNEWRPDFAVMVGDMIEGNSTDPARINGQWEEFLSHVDALNIPLFIIPGNHDIPYPAALDDWHTRHGRSYYSFTYRDCLFIMLNAMESWKDNGAYLGEAQIAYVRQTLQRYAGVRHTFMFVHVPYWHEANAEWFRIEEELRERPHTVFAGHIHRNSYEERNGGRYLAVAASKGVAPLTQPPSAPEFGLFPAWVQVCVDDKDVRLTLIEPGADRQWPASIAPTAYLKAFRDLISAEAMLPEQVDDGFWKTGYMTTVNNGLPAAVSVHLTVQHPADDAWKPISELDAEAILEVGPGEKKTIAQRFVVPERRLTPAPVVRTKITYKDETFGGQNTRNLPIFPKAVMRWPKEWMAVTPVYGAGPISNSLPADPRKEWPLLFASHPAEKGYNTGGFSGADGIARTWKTIPVAEIEDSALVNMGLLSELPDKVFSYASTYVHSPKARTAYIQFRVDDFGQVFVNGLPVDDGRIYRTRRNPVFVAIRLEMGWNNVCVKAINNGGGWTFHCLFADPDAELRFANTPE